MVKGIYHINVNVTDFERSLAFYQLLDFKIVRDLGEVGNTYLERGLKIPRLLTSPAPFSPTISNIAIVSASYPK